MLYTRQCSTSSQRRAYGSAHPSPTCPIHSAIRLLNRGLLLTVAVAIPLMGLWACASEGGEADLILMNGTVYTMSWAEPDAEGAPAADAPFDAADGWHADAEAVAVRDGRIVFIGTSADAEAYRGASTRVMELEGATVLPGLIESHVHIVQLGASLFRAR